jgi:hypothetical protein
MAPRAPVPVRLAGRIALSTRFGTKTLPPFAASNERETGKNCQCAAILMVFRQNSDVV